MESLSNKGSFDFLLEDKTIKPILEAINFKLLITQGQLIHYFFKKIQESTNPDYDLIQYNKINQIVNRWLLWAEPTLENQADILFSEFIRIFHDILLEQIDKIPDKLTTFTQKHSIFWKTEGKQQMYKAENIYEDSKFLPELTTPLDFSHNGSICLHKTQTNFLFRIQILFFRILSYLGEILSSPALKSIILKKYDQTQLLVRIRKEFLIYLREEGFELRSRCAKGMLKIWKRKLGFDGFELMEGLLRKIKEEEIIDEELSKKGNTSRGNGKKDKNNDDESKSFWCCKKKPRKRINQIFSSKHNLKKDDIFQSQGAQREIKEWGTSKKDKVKSDKPNKGTRSSKADDSGLDILIEHQDSITVQNQLETLKTQLKALYLDDLKELANSKSKLLLFSKLKLNFDVLRCVSIPSGFLTSLSKQDLKKSLEVINEKIDEGDGQKRQLITKSIRKNKIVKRIPNRPKTTIH